MSATEGIVTLVERRSAAIRDKDLDRLMALYVPDVISYDLVPPLVYDGRTSLRSIFERWLGGYGGALGMEIRDLTVVAEGTLGYAHWLNRTSGTLRDGTSVTYWARATLCCRELDGEWLITHEHLSLPVDFTTATAAMDLSPE